MFDCAAEIYQLWSQIIRMKNDLTEYKVKESLINFLKDIGKTRKYSALTILEKL